jgi:hypothetical protein
VAEGREVNRGNQLGSATGEQFSGQRYGLLGFPADSVGVSEPGKYTQSRGRFGRRSAVKDLWRVPVTLKCSGW